MTGGSSEPPVCTVWVCWRSSRPEVAPGSPLRFASGRLRFAPHYPLVAGLGSMRHLANSQAGILASYSFDPFGAPLSPSGGSRLATRGNGLP